MTAVVCSDKFLGTTLKNSFQSSVALLCGSLLAVLTIAIIPGDPAHDGVVYTALFLISLLLLYAAQLQPQLRTQPARACAGTQAGLRFSRSSHSRAFA